MEHERGGSKAILVVSPLVALMEDQVCILMKHGVRASILGFPLLWPRKTSLQLSALAETICFFASGSPYHSEVARCLEGFSSRIVCVKVVSLYPIKSIMDQSFFTLFLICAHRRARARGLGGMIKKIVTSLVVHVMDLVCLYLS